MMSNGAHAADCNPGKTLADDMSPEQAQAVYDCLKDDLYQSYNKGKIKGKVGSFAKDFRS